MTHNNIRDFVIAASGFAPTDEQAAIIGADPTKSHLVIAGAGSGKTTTMSQRVAWLVSREVFEPSQILGLTFTKKAAAELGHGISKQLASTGHTEDILGSDGVDVSTYNAFAAALYREHAALIGYDPEAVVLHEGAAWQLAWKIVSRCTSPVLETADISVVKLTEAVLRMAHELSDNLADPVKVSKYAHKMLASVIEYAANVEKWPEAKPKRSVPTAQRVALEQAKFFELMPVIIELAVDFQKDKKNRGFIEYSDQVARAFEIVKQFPEVGQRYRERYRTVLLDEYQDTSVVQTQFLAELFSDTSVIAVGDPNQSIYGFRGASANNLLQFGDHFRTKSTFSLSTSWRNPTSVLTVANKIAHPLRNDVAGNKGVADAAVELQPRPDADNGNVDVFAAITHLEEYAHLSEWMKDRISANPSKTAAVLVRKKNQLRPVVAALRQAGVEYQVTGLAGVLSEPVIVDLVAALRAAYDPGANAEIVRLLSGARWQVAPADLEALSGLAKRLLRTSADGSEFADSVRTAQYNSLEQDERASLVDAVEAIRTDQLPSSSFTKGFSEDGLVRIREAGTLLHRLRSRVGMPLSDVMAHAITLTRVDIEADANSKADLAEEALDSFANLIADFASFSDSVSLGTFLEWLSVVEEREQVSPRQQPARAGVVQVMTAHSSKGLEWDFVAVPGLTERDFPLKPQSTMGWLSNGHLPYEFRGDKDVLPVIDFTKLTSEKFIHDVIKDFKCEVKKKHEMEERRLAYVAVTRSKSELLLSWSPFSERAKRVEIGEFLTEAIQALNLPSKAGNPAGVGEQVKRELRNWPLDPLGSRRESVTAAAVAVRAAKPGGTVDEGLRRRIDALQAEHRGEETEAIRPTRVGASMAKDFIDNPEQALRRTRRPVPVQPFAQTRLGTLFHDWAEGRVTNSSSGGLDDGGHEIAPSDETIPNAFDQAELDRLKAVFGASQWGDWKAAFVEREIQLPIAGTVFPCKIDAVFEVGDRDTSKLDIREGAKYQVVDWKTGKVPADEADLELKQTQLALYRIAYAKHMGVPVEDIDAVFYYVSEDKIIRPSRFYDEAEFSSLWGEKMGSVATSSTSD